MHRQKNIKLWNRLVAWIIQGAAEITPTFWKWIKIKRNKVHKNFFIYRKHIWCNFFQILLKITSLKCRPLLMTNSWSRSRTFSMALRVIAVGMAATSCRIASFNCSIVPGRRTSPWNYWNYCRSQWPRGLRRRSTVARLLRSWVWIPQGTWIFVCCDCCVL